jgi:hypothetical protein
MGGKVNILNLKKKPHFLGSTKFKLLRLINGNALFSPIFLNNTQQQNCLAGGTQ